MAGNPLASFSAALQSLTGALSLGGATAVGLSIGSSSIKIVEIKKSGKNYKLLHFGIIQLPEDTIVNREIVNNVAIVENIKSLINQLRLKNKQVCTSLSGTSVIIKRMTLEVPSMKELQDQVFWEAEQYLPFDVSEVVMDFQVLSKSKDNKVDVVLVAVKSSILDSYLSVISDSGLKSKVVDVDFFALQNVFELNYPQKPSEAVAIVDIGATAIKMVVVQDGVPVFTKDTVLGGRNLTSEIQKHLNLSYDDAESLKVGGQENIPQEVSDLMTIMAENIAGEIKRALDFYSASSSGAPVAYVLLAGGTAKIPHLSQIVEDQIKLPTQLMNPFNAIQYDSSIFNPEYIAAIAPIAAVPIGLALRSASK